MKPYQAFVIKSGSEQQYLEMRLGNKSLARKKEQKRERDRARIKRGEVTRDQLQAENSIILILASECGMILVGGQAVNSWALLLEKPEDEPWKSLRPYTSLDADMLCSEYQMLKFAKTLSASHLHPARAYGGIKVASGLGEARFADPPGLHHVSQDKRGCLSGSGCRSA